jgi:subtilisin family serine protease
MGSTRLVTLLSFALALCVVNPAHAQSVTRVLVRFDSDATAAQRADIRSDAGVDRTANLAVKGLELVDPKPGVSVDDAVSDLEQADGVLYAEPDHTIHATAVPDDPGFDDEWGLGVIRAPEAWDVTTGSPGVTVAVVDTGMDATDPDLAPNLYTNPEESGGGRETNGIDDDGDGRIDDVHGWDYVGGDNQPQDANGHGTHVAGTIGARGNDANGVAGVSWSTSLMPLRVLDANGSGHVSDAVTAYSFAARSGVRIVNASLGGSSYSRAEHDAIAAAPNTLFVVAAGNDSRDNDSIPDYPCDYDLPNIVCVAATDQSDALASFSNYGDTNVDLAAPGVDIVSTWPGDQYAQLSGTSMATPHVSGAAALVLAHTPDLTTAGLRSALLGSVAPVASLAGKVATGGRLDVAAALAAPAPTPQPAPQPAASPPPVVTPTAPSRSLDHAAPGVALTIDRVRLRVLRTRGLRVALGVSEACRTRIDLEVDARTAKRLHLRSRVLGRTTVSLGAAGHRAATVRLSAKAARALRSLSRLRVVAHAVATDAAGNRRGTERAATLKR